MRGKRLSCKGGGDPAAKRGANAAVVLFATVAAMIMSHAGCAVPPRRSEPAPARDAASLVESFMRKVVSGDHEGAFACMDIDTLVNLGRPQAELYYSLSPEMQGRYRRDFIEGVYAALFRDLPPAAAAWTVTAPDAGGPAVEVTGHAGRRMRLLVQETAKGLKIVALERQ